MTVAGYNLSKFVAVTACLLLVAIFPKGVTAETFTVDGRVLRDPCGEPFVIRGVNAGIAFPQDPTASKLSEISKTGANTVRLTFRWLINRSDPRAVFTAIRESAENGMVAVPSLWDATGDWQALQFVVDYWSQPSMVAVLRQFEDVVLLNFANEAGDFSVSSEQYKNGYRKAILQLRNAGLHMPLVIDAAGWGRRESYILESANYLLAEDPDHNLVFSWHPWDTGQPETRYRKAIDAAIEAKIPLIVGEFASTGAQHEGDIDYRFITKYTADRDIGWLWWWWSSGQDTDSHAVTANGDYGNWVNVGEEIAVLSPYGIKATSRRSDYLQMRKCLTVETLEAAPKSPSRLVAAATQGAEVWLNWQDNSDNEKNFDIQIWDELTRDWRLIKTVGPNSTSTTVGADLAFVYSMWPGTVRDPSLDYETTYRFRVGAYVSNDLVSFSDPVIATTKVEERACSDGDGLKGEYFSAEHRSQEFAKYDRPSLIRIDPQIDFNWGAGSPAVDTIGSDHFQVRWTGQVKPQHSGKFTFFTDSDDFARVWVNEEKVIDNWRGNAGGWAQGAANLEGGKKYAIRVEYREWDRDAKISLQWASSRHAREIIPQCRLFSQVSLD